MRKNKDSLAKEYISDNAIFADLINFYFFDGEKKVIDSDLKELDTTQVETLKDDFTIQRYRDLVKEACIKEDSNNTYIIFGIENQSEIDNGMVFRCMIYDALSYLKQLDNIEKPNKNDKIKLKPVITLVLYLGNGEWDGPKSIYEIIDMEKYQFIKDRIYDYKLHLISPYEIKNEDFTKLTSEMRIVLKCIKKSHNSEEFDDLINNDTDFKMVSNKAIGLINEVADTEFKTNENGGYVDMCKAIEDMKKEAEAKGKNEGKIEGKIEGRNETLIENAISFYKNGASLELISTSLGMSIEDVKNILIQNNVELRMA